jgi:hypothetical protein
VSECRSCAAPLAEGQRYCVTCGTRLGDLRLPANGPADRAAPGDAAPARRVVSLRFRGHTVPLTLPGRWSASALAGVVLGCGVLLGAAIGPAVAGQGIASAAGRVVLLGGGGSSGAPSGSGSSGTAAAPALGAPEGNEPSSSPPADTSGDQSGGSSETTAAGTGPSTPVETAPESSDSAPVESTPGTDNSDTSSTDPTVKGVVVHLVEPAHSYVIATDTGQLVPVHARKLPDAGTKVETVVHQLANGTFLEKKVAKKGTASAAKLSGTVTYVDGTARVYTVSVRGASTLVHMPQQQPGPPPPSDQPPALNDLVTVDVTIAPKPADPAKPDDPQKTELDQSKIEKTGQASGPVDLEGTVQAIDTQQRTLTLAADDSRESAHDVVISVPATIDMTKLQKDDVLDVTATIAADGSYALTGASHDQDDKAADDGTLALGDQAPASATEIK